MTQTLVKASMLSVAIHPRSGTTYTVLATDRGKIVTFSNASAIAVTLPQAIGNFGTGFFFWCQNIGAGTVTITPTTSTINGAATLTLITGQGAFIASDGTNYAAVADSQATRAGLGLATTDSPQFAALNVGHASDTTLARAAAGEVSVEGTLLKKVGKETIWIPAAAMTARTTNGPGSPVTVEMATNRNMFVTLDFDTTTQEFAQFEIRMPKSWNLSTVTFQPVWSHASTTTNFGVVWSLAAVARSDGDAGDVAFGTSQTSTDTGGTTNAIQIGPESAAITVAGSPAVGDTVQFQVARNPADAADTLAIDARLHGVCVFFTSNASTDA